MAISISQYPDTLITHLTVRTAKKAAYNYQYRLIRADKHKYRY